MPNIELLEKSMPVAPIRIAALGCRELAEEVDRKLVKFRKELVERKQLSVIPQGYSEESFIVECECPRFGTGEGKGYIKESVRGTDLYIMVDVTNYSESYTVCGHENHMSPDNHFQDLKRIISAATGKAHRINVIMPFLYEGRQHRRTKRESLDCALALKELSDMGVSNIITFDAHDPRVQNSIPLNGFDNFFPTYQFLKALIKSVPDLRVDNDHLMIISPDEGAMSRAVYFSNILGVDMGMFYKRRDYSTIVNGKNPIVAHEFLGDSVEGKDVVVIDDMISSGGSMLDVAKQLKERNAKRVFVCTTYGLFTDGLDKFDEYYEKGWLDRVITTNLNYRIPELLERPYYVEANMSKYLASIIVMLLNALASLGHKGIKTLRTFGRAGLMLFNALVGKPEFRKHAPLLVRQLYNVGVLSMLIIVVSGVFIGMVLGLQGYLVLTTYSAETSLGMLVALSLLRELGPVVAALLFAGRAGSALTAEIGLMRATEQLSSMEMMAVDPLRRVISPRFWAGVISLPLLTVIFVAVGIWGGSLVGVSWKGIDSGFFWSAMQNAVDWRMDLVNCLIKSVVFAITVTWISLFNG